MATFEVIKLGGNPRRITTVLNDNFEKLNMPAGTQAKGDLGGLAAGTDLSGMMVTDVIKQIVSGATNSVEILSAELTGLTAVGANTYAIPFSAASVPVTGAKFTVSDALVDLKAPKKVVVTAVKDVDGDQVATETVEAGANLVVSGDDNKELTVTLTTLAIPGNVYDVVGEPVIVKAVITLADETEYEYTFQVITQAHVYHGAIAKQDDVETATGEVILPLVQGASPVDEIAVDGVVENIQFTSDATKTFFIATAAELDAITTSYGINELDAFQKVETTDATYKYVYLLKSAFVKNGLDVFFDASFNDADANEGTVANTFVTFKNIWYNEAGPLDAKLTVAATTDLATIAPVSYKGMIVYCVEDSTRYEFDGATFKALRPFSKVEDEKVNIDADELNWGDFVINVHNLPIGDNITIDNEGNKFKITADNVKAALGYTPEDVAKKGVANGYASLDANSTVPVAQLPTEGINASTLNGHPDTYFASAEQLNQAINGLEWKPSVADKAALKALTTPQEGWTVSVDDSNKIYRFDAANVAAEDSGDERVIKANDGTAGAWIQLGTAIYDPATSSKDGLMSAADKAKLDKFADADNYALKTDVATKAKHVAIATGSFTAGEGADADYQKITLTLAAGQHIVNVMRTDDNTNYYEAFVDIEINGNSATIWSAEPFNGYAVCISEYTNATGTPSV